MKKLVSLLLAIAMLLACASALAEIPEGFHAEESPSWMNPSPLTC